MIKGLLGEEESAAESLVVYGELMRGLKGEELCTVRELRVKLFGQEMGSMVGRFTV